MLKSDVSRAVKQVALAAKLFNVYLEKKHGFCIPTPYMGVLQHISPLVAETFVLFSAGFARLTSNFR
jgi:hypothetical protein